MAAVDHRHRFATGGRAYERFRPRYPEALVERLAGAIAAAGAPEAAVVDVGAGTGIFTRQLAEALGRLADGAGAILGIDPSADMLAAARESTSPGMGIRWIEGGAEALPVGDGAARAVVAATAAHWFDRKRFYGECRRVLRAGGVLAIAEYRRDRGASPAAAAIEAFLAKPGGRGARPDYGAELAGLEGFAFLGAWGAGVDLRLAPGEVVGLALSSSYATAVVAGIGREAAERRILDLVGGMAEADGKVAVGYRFQLFMARKL